MHSIIKKFIAQFRSTVKLPVKISVSNNDIRIQNQAQVLNLTVFKEKIEPPLKKGRIYISEDQIYTKPEILISLCKSKLKLNKTIFARNCELCKISSQTAIEFLNTYHLMGYAKSAFHYGLLHKGELVAVMTFSKGRKMRRLAENKRSFEIIRFCSKDNVTITGGLSKLIKRFVEEKCPGDLMTYIDKQFGSGESYLKIGFHIAEETPKQIFIINRADHTRSYYSDEKFNIKTHYLTENLGNIKLIYTIG